MAYRKQTSQQNSTSKTSRGLMQPTNKINIKQTAFCSVQKYFVPIRVN